MATLPLKKNYRCETALQQFYGGGPLVVSLDGSFIVCACGESINIVHSSNGSVESTIEGDSDTITALGLSPDDKLLFSSGHSRQIKGHDGPIIGMACHPSGGLLATAGGDRKVLVWVVMVASALILLQSFFLEVVMQLYVFGIFCQRNVATLERHFSTVTSLVITEDGQILLSTGRDKVVNLWDPHDYNCKLTVPTYEMVEAVCVIPSGFEFDLFLGSYAQRIKEKRIGSPEIYFITVGNEGLWVCGTLTAQYAYMNKSLQMLLSTLRRMAQNGVSLLLFCCLWIKD